MYFILAPCSLYYCRWLTLAPVQHRNKDPNFRGINFQLISAAVTDVVTLTPFCYSVFRWYCRLHFSSLLDGNLAAALTNTGQTLKSDFRLHLEPIMMRRIKVIPPPVYVFVWQSHPSFPFLSPPFAINCCSTPRSYNPVPLDLPYHATVVLSEVMWHPGSAIERNEPRGSLWCHLVLQVGHGAV